MNASQHMVPAVRSPSREKCQERKKLNSTGSGRLYLNWPLDISFTYFLRVATFCIRRSLEELRVHASWGTSDHAREFTQPSQTLPET